VNPEHQTRASILIDGTVQEGVFIPTKSSVMASTDVATEAVLAFIERLDFGSTPSVDWEP